MVLRVRDAWLVGVGKRAPHGNQCLWLVAPHDSLDRLKVCALYFPMIKATVGGYPQFSLPGQSQKKVQRKPKKGVPRGVPSIFTPGSKPKKGTKKAKKGCTSSTIPFFGFDPGSENWGYPPTVALILYRILKDRHNRARHDSPG